MSVREKVFAALEARGLKFEDYEPFVDVIILETLKAWPILRREVHLGPNSDAKINEDGSVEMFTVYESPEAILEKEFKHVL